MQLKKSTIEDIHTFFQHQLDPEANFMAGFTSKAPNDKDAYITKWTRLLDDSTVSLNTVWIDDKIAGNVTTYEMEGETQISYWIDKAFWGKGIATKALLLFLNQFEKRPIYGRVAFDNYGSIRVLEKCGFSQIGRDMYFANARGKEIEEVIFRIE